MKKPLETSRNPGARETGQGAGCVDVLVPIQSQSLHSFPNLCSRRGRDVNENGVGGITRLRIKSSLRAPAPNLNRELRHSIPVVGRAWI